MISISTGQLYTAETKPSPLLFRIENPAKRVVFRAEEYFLFAHVIKTTDLCILAHDALQGPI